MSDFSLLKSHADAAPRRRKTLTKFPESTLGGIFQQVPAPGEGGHGGEAAILVRHMHGLGARPAQRLAGHYQYALF